MPSAFTVYCCGTNFHRDSEDVVGRMYRATAANECYINDGPGSGTWKPNRFGGRSNPGGASKVGGLVFGVGVDANIEGTIRHIAGLKPLPRIVNMCGWSRGGVTCVKIANVMHRMGPPLSTIAVNVFAIDPVPGSNPGGGDMWKHIRLTPNVARFASVLAQHDDRLVNFFEPLYPKLDGPSVVDIDVMPETHSSIVVFKGGGREDPAEVVQDMAARFLLTHGTAFRRPPRLLTPVELLARYGKIQANFVEFAHVKSAADLGTKQRAVKDASGKTVGSLSMQKPPFWINEHHHELMLGTWPFVARTIDSNAPRALDGDARRRWDLEVAEMRQRCMEQAQTVIAWGMMSGVRRYE
jgi:hypothetical protein